jgi:Holliday junction resolvase RusA-like endonuclease
MTDERQPTRQALQLPGVCDRVPDVRDADDALRPSGLHGGSAGVLEPAGLAVEERRASVPEARADDAVTEHDDRRLVAFVVLGTPAPKGSARAFFKAGMKRAVIVKDNDERQRSWDRSVREAALEALPVPEVMAFVQTALDVTIVFHVKRPAGHYSKATGKLKPGAPPRPLGKPDIDKLARTTLDAMTGSVFDDDSRIADLQLSKRWAMPGREGATISVTEARA